MPRVFVYEYLTAVGLGRDPADPLHGMYREGRAMRDAVAADFEQVPGVVTATLDGVTPGEERERFEALLGVSDFALVIAPETDRIYLERTKIWGDQFDTRRLSPMSGFIRETSDKLYTAEDWVSAGVRTPRTWPLGPDLSAPRWPVVWKPRDGCGSTATIRIDRPDDAPLCRKLLEAEGYTGELIAQEWVPGLPASVAFLGSPRFEKPIPLVPALQLLSDDGRFTYQGGVLPLRADLADRAVRLGTAAVQAFGAFYGYVGVDLILGDAADGSEDYAIEVNPRLTTSYVGLRELADFNLAGAMLALAAGETVTPVWKPGAVRFYPDGRVERLSGLGEFFE